MGILHLANINFEWELETHSSLSLKEAFQVHPNFLQLQFLPLLFAGKEAGALVTHLPPESYLMSLEAMGLELPSLHLMDEKDLPYDRIESWGWSESVEKWADHQNLLYAPPPFLKIRELASKTFAFTHSPNLPGAKLLHTPAEVESWLKTESYPKVLKTSYGFAGRGKFLLESADFYPTIQAEVMKMFEEGHILIGEPWVPRLFDFSTQWYLGDEESPQLLGATHMENTPDGTYRKTSTMPFGMYEPFLEKHLEQVKIPLQLILEEGYHGYLGIDAMVYRNPQTMDEALHPIVEINLRKTMGWLALKLTEKFSPLSIAYTTNEEEGLLPSFLEIEKNKKIPFRKQLTLDIVKP